MFLAGFKIILQAALFSVFIYMYGMPSMEKLEKQSTIVIKTRQNTNGIPAPSITIAIRNNITRTGWKRNANSTKLNDRLVHQCKNFSTVEECLDSETFPWHDLIDDTILGFNSKGRHPLRN